jgi:hypothetical protein
MKNIQVSYYQTPDGEITEGFQIIADGGRLIVSCARHGHDSYNYWSQDTDTDSEPVKSPRKLRFVECLLAAALFIGMTPEVDSL